VAGWRERVVEVAGAVRSRLRALVRTRAGGDESSPAPDEQDPAPGEPVEPRASVVGRALDRLRASAPGTRRVLRWGAAAVVLAWVAALVADLSTDLAAPRPSVLVVDRRGEYLGEVPGEGDALGYWPLPAALPERLVRATLETEDRRFFEHPGVSASSLARAAWQDLRALEIVSGGSTLAMQTARLQAPGRRTLTRKAREAVEALLLVRRHGHDRVLRQYLTLAPYGHRVRGVVRAARLYFAKPVEDLSWAQAAFLAALPQAPGRMDPYDPDGLARAVRRQQRILRALRARGVLTADELAQALGADLGLVPKPAREPAALHAVLDLAGRLPPARPGGEPVVTAALDLEVQRLAARIVADELAPLRAGDAGNAAALVVDPETGAVLARVGSADYFDGEARGAIDYTRVPRSPGSSLKPFVYALALASGRFTAASELDDTPLDLPSEGGTFLPENANHLWFGPVLLRPALANSRNIPALRLAGEVGPDAVQGFLARAGVAAAKGEAQGLGIAIGTLPASLEELAQAYLVLARGGTGVPLRMFVGAEPFDGAEPTATSTSTSTATATATATSTSTSTSTATATATAIPNAEDDTDARLERSAAQGAARSRGAPAETRLLPEPVARLVTDVLSDPEARRPTFAPGSALDYPYAVAVKTGTSQGFRDAWTVAYSDRLLVAVWVGNHDLRRMNQLTGQAAAAPIAHRIMDAVMPLRAPHRPVALAFPSPPGAVTRTVCALSGRLAGKDCPHARAEAFLPGTEPTEACAWHRPVPIDVRNGLRAGPTCPRRFVAARRLLDLPARYAGWAEAQRLEIAPLVESPLCPRPGEEAAVAITSPPSGARYLLDPETPPEAATIRLAARVTPADEPVVFLVDGTPVATVRYPHAYRWTATPGRHEITARLARRAVGSKAVRIVVGD
jgi:penicillin-binding protein 1C